MIMQCSSSAILYIYILISKNIHNIKLRLFIFIVKICEINQNIVNFSLVDVFQIFNETGIVIMLLYLHTS